MQQQNNKLRVTQEYERLSEELKEQIKLVYPYGFSRHLITFKNREGKNIKGLRFETDEKIYLIRMTVVEAQNIILRDDDYDDEGNLKDDVKEEYEDKYADVEYLPDVDTFEEDDSDDDD